MTAEWAGMAGMEQQKNVICIELHDHFCISFIRPFDLKLLLLRNVANHHPRLQCVSP